jgi:beta-lactamase regulating signal transducer with metallopeptidase domain
MITLLWWLAQNTITIAVMILFAAAASRLFRNHPAVEHMLWVVILLKFVTPPIVSWPWSVQLLGQSLRSLVASEAHLAPATPTERPAIDRTAIPNEMIDASAIENWTPPGELGLRDIPLAVPRPVALTPGRADLARASFALVVVFWLVGCVLWTTRQARRIARHASLVRRGKSPPIELTSEVEDMARQIGVRPPRAVVASAILSPFVWFLGRLRLVWPEAMAAHDVVIRSRGVIAHELAHIRRRDHWVAGLDLAAGLVWWWNPLYWFVRRRTRAAAELACDAIAIGTSASSRKAYAELLLELATSPQALLPAAGLGIGAGTHSSFERRLSMILSDRVSDKVSVPGLLTASFLALVALPGWSLADQEPPRNESSTGFVDDIAYAVPFEPNAVQAQDRPAETPQPNARAPESASSAGTTAERLQKLEADIQKLTRFLESGAPLPEQPQLPDQPEEPQLPEKPGQPQLPDQPRLPRGSLELPDLPPRSAGLPSLQPDVPAQPRVSRRQIARRAPKTATLQADYIRIRDPMSANAPIVMLGRGRTYILAAAEKGAYLTALSADGRQIWLSHFAGPAPIRGLGVEWSLEEPTDQKLVILNRAGPNERLRFVFDTNTGALRPAPDAALPSSPDLGFPVNLRVPAAVAERLDRLEKAVAELQKRLEDRRSRRSLDALPKKR